jgi:hypothetical protein
VVLVTTSGGNGSTEAFGRILIEHSSISILNGEYQDFPELDGGLVAASENYVLICAVCNGTVAGVRLVIHEREISRASVLRSQDDTPEGPVIPPAAHEPRPPARHWRSSHRRR